MGRTRFRLKLFLVMIVFALIISLTTATIAYLQIRDHVIIDNEQQINTIQEMAEDSLKAIEKAYFFFDKSTAEKMEANTIYLIQKYEEQPSFEKWDFKELKDILNMDIYVINDKNVITYSSFQKDIGLDFNVCCKKLARILDERRESGKFYVDGLDIEQQTGEIKKYSYMATDDKRYIIQLGYSLQNSEIFREFNFLSAIDELTAKYPSINEINILNLGGYSLGQPVEEAKLSKERRNAFEHTLKTKEKTELKANWHNEPAIYRYVPYESDFDEGTTKNKVIEIIYNQYELESVLNKNLKSFIIQFLISLTITILIAFLISRWVSKPMYLAYHDSLTGLMNRSAFEERVRHILSENKGTTAFLMLDLDNFKTVNDDFGHDKGDELLKKAANLLRNFLRKGDRIFRLGGDEFVIIMTSVDFEETKIRAQELIEQMSEHFKQITEAAQAELSVSIGIAFAPEHGIDPEELYKKADMALYKSKQKGKNQFSIYANEGLGN
ncbi:hypothetical protein DCC39_09155 [Pueribacillus theae]|uniref:GGDEF domain-containing protein n=1 Tax=Pueribacillus theae TaxID=2171751 RepID=A0A2U1K2Q0_9BACI|nr:GGDEF domain-containing protein [Pueribacillus theae]PWA11797.1 hypothetical protein DCC39_09155 [Pueribacillus theae]